MIKKLVLVTTVLTASGCTSISVTPLDASYQVKKICIRENPRVIVDDLVPVITQSLERHHIQSEFVTSKISKATAQDSDNDSESYWMDVTPIPDSCDFNLTYTARQSWDFTTYLSTADIVISKKTSTIANANYHLRNKGGLSLLKWQGVRTKLEPVLDELLQFYP